MKTCPNCEGTGKRNYEGDEPGQHPCRMCVGRGEILEPSDMVELAKGWLAIGEVWHVPDFGRFNLQQIMTLVLGADAVPGRLSKAARKESGLSLAWKGVIIHPRRRR